MGLAFFPLKAGPFLFAKRKVVRVSLRDELETLPSRYVSEIDAWLSGKDKDFQLEFWELVNDRGVRHARLHWLANKHGCPIKIGRFSEWRRSQWD